MTKVLPDYSLEHLQSELALDNIDTTGMSRQAMQAFVTARVVSGELVSNEPPTAVHELMATPTDFNVMVKIGMRHFGQPHELASGTE